MILFLTLLFTTVASKPSDFEMADKVDKEILQLSTPTLDLLQEFDSLIEKYNCDLGDAECAAFKAASMIDDLVLEHVNCDDDDETTELLCSQAKKMLGIQEGEVASDEDIKEALLKIYETLLTDDNITLLNAVSKAMEDYLCFKEPASCELIRYLLLKELCNILCK